MPPYSTPCILSATPRQPTHSLSPLHSVPSLQEPRDHSTETRAQSPEPKGKNVKLQRAEVLRKAKKETETEMEKQPETEMSKELKGPPENSTEGTAQPVVNGKGGGGDKLGNEGWREGSKRGKGTEDRQGNPSSKTQAEA